MNPGVVKITCILHTRSLACLLASDTLMAPRIRTFVFFSRQQAMKLLSIQLLTVQAKRLRSLNERLHGLMNTTWRRHPDMYPVSMCHLDWNVSTRPRSHDVQLHAYFSQSPFKHRRIRDYLFSHCRQPAYPLPRSLLSANSPPCGSNPIDLWQPSRRIVLGGGEEKEGPRDDGK